MRDDQLLAVFNRTLAMYQPDRAPELLSPGVHLNSWDWGPGVAIYGLHKAYPRLPDESRQAYFRFWRDWFEANLDRNPPTKAINSASVLNGLWQGIYDQELPLEPSKRNYYLDYVKQRIDFYLKNASRVKTGAYSHSVAGGYPDSERQVWADNLFMLVLLLAQVAATNGDAGLFGEMVRQLQLHYQLLTDPDTNLLFHGWQEEGQPSPHLNGALWGRGNGWAALGAIELLELALKSGFETLKGPILDYALPHFKALLAFQRPDGRWHTLIDKEWSYPETSVTAALAYAFLKGSRLGGLGNEFHEAGKKALAALKGQITPEGVVLGVSDSTPLLSSLEAYNAVPADSIFTWGQGIALLALSEEFFRAL